jgi:cation diffusion facilitator family transporter
MAEKRLERSLRVTFLGMLVNVALATIKITAGVLGHAQALVADGIESASDLISSLIVWRGVVVAAEPPDDEHPYGHGKAEPLAAAVVATILMGAAVWIIIGSIQDIIRPHSGPAPFTLAVLVAVVLIKEVLFRHVMKEGLDLESSAVRADAWHHRSDAITSLAAFVGISVAVLGGPGYEAADDYAAVLAGGIIAFNGWRLFRPAMDELMDIAPDTTFADRIAVIAATIPEVEQVEKCRARKMGNQFFVEMHVEVDPAMTVERAHAIAHRVKDGVRARLPEVKDVLVHIEPAGRGKPTPSNKEVSKGGDNPP